MLMIQQHKTKVNNFRELPITTFDKTIYYNFIFIKQLPFGNYSLCIYKQEIEIIFMLYSISREGGQNVFDFGFLGEYFSTFLKGVGITLGISIITVFLGILLGSILFFMKTSKFHIWKVKPLKVIASIYVEVIRGTPMLLQIMMVYSGSKLIFDIDISAFSAAIIAIGLNSAAYVSEIVRAGIEAVDNGQM